MENEKDYIDKLYSDKFEKFEFQTSGDDWNKLNSKLSKSNFLKFSFATFNIFFLAAILTFAGTATYFGVNHIIQSKKIEKLEQRIEVLQQNENKNETNQLITDSTANDKQMITNKIKAVSNVKINKVSQNTIDDKDGIKEILPELDPKNESINVKPDSSAIIKPEAQKIKRIKKTTYIKKDKIFVTDTVRIKKKDK